MVIRVEKRPAKYTLVTSEYLNLLGRRENANCTFFILIANSAAKATEYLS